MNFRIEFPFYSVGKVYAMHPISRTQKIISLLLKLVIILSAAIGSIICFNSGAENFMGGARVFMYFTFQSNIALALISLIGGFFLLRGKGIPGVWHIIRLIGAVSITMTGAVFSFVLAPSMDNSIWNIQNILVHVIVPAVSVFDFFLIGISGDIGKKAAFLVVIPPFLYVIYAGIGYICNWQFGKGANYPYFFLNWGNPAGAFGFSGAPPYMGCVWWIFALGIVIIAVGFLYIFILDVLKKLVYKVK